MKVIRNPKKIKKSKADSVPSDYTNVEYALREDTSSAINFLRTYHGDRKSDFTSNLIKTFLEAAKATFYLEEIATDYKPDIRWTNYYNENEPFNIFFYKFMLPIDNNLLDILRTKHDNLKDDSVRLDMLLDTYIQGFTSFLEGKSVPIGYTNLQEVRKRAMKNQDTHLVKVLNDIETAPPSKEIKFTPAEPMPFHGYNVVIKN